jgi:hypothetical protein
MRKTLFVLVTINLVTSIYSFYLANQTMFSDSIAYINMAKSIGQGTFSSWYFLENFYFETLRTPVYPFFLYILSIISSSKLFVLFIQLILYYLSLIIGCKLIFNKTNNFKSILLFLVFTAINIQIPYYAGLIATESLSFFLYILFCYIGLTKPLNVKNSILLGIIAATAFSIKPVFLFIPIIYSLYLILFSFKRNVKFILCMMLVYIMLILPFGIWNHMNHGKFKITPIEGGAGVAHLGFWMHKLPPNYKEEFYWGNQIPNDYLNPFKLSAKDYNDNLESYKKEWRIIQKNLEKNNDCNDLKIINEMKSFNPGIFELKNSNYTIEREKMLWERTIQNIINHPIYYLKTRLYTFFRNFTTGIDLNGLKQTKNTFGLIKIYIPFILSFIFIFCGLIFLIYSTFAAKKDLFLIFLLFISIYQGIIHVPFAIQARYTIPVHLIILMLLAINFSNLKTKQSS